MDTREYIDSALIEKDITLATAARMFGWSPQQLGQRLMRKSLRSDEFLKLMETLGYEIHFTSKDKGSEMKTWRKGHGRRVRAMSNTIIFDTDVSDAISNDFYENGVDESLEDGTAHELYVDSNGRYFFAEYIKDHPEKDRVHAVHPNIARAFIEKYGEEIEKGQ